MRKIYKYPLQITNRQTLQLPVDAYIIHTGLDPQGKPCVWAKVNPDAPPEPINFAIYGTGHTLDEAFTNHAGSFVQGDFVWHVFYQYP